MRTKRKKEKEKERMSKREVKKSVEGKRWNEKDRGEKEKCE